MPTVLPRIQGYAEQGGHIVTVSGLSSTPTDYQQSYPLCTVTIHEAGTNVLASLFSDNSGSTPQANPFTADATAFWGAYLSAGPYDVTFSGTGISSPFTLFAVNVGGSGGSVGGSEWGVFNPQDFGALFDGITNDTAAFTTMLTEIGSLQATVIFPNVISSGVKTQTLLSSLTFPSNVTLDFFPGGGLSVVTGQLVQILGPITAPPMKIFFNATGSLGKIRVGTNADDDSRRIYPPPVPFNPIIRGEWWGMVGNDSTDCADAFEAAALALPNGWTLEIGSGQEFHLSRPVTVHHKWMSCIRGTQSKTSDADTLSQPLFVYTGVANTTDAVITFSNVRSCSFEGFQIYCSDTINGTAASAIFLTYTAPGGYPTFTSHCNFEGLNIWALTTRTDWKAIRVGNVSGNNEQHTFKQISVVGQDTLGTHQVGISLEQTQVQRLIIDRCEFSSVGIGVDIQGNLLASNCIFSAVGTAWHSQSANNNVLITGDDGENINNIIDVDSINGACAFHFIACKYNSINTLGTSYGASPINNLAGANLIFESCAILSSGASQDFGPYLLSGPNAGGSVVPVAFNNCTIGTFDNPALYAPGFSTCSTTVTKGVSHFNFGNGITTSTSTPLRAAAPLVASSRDIISLAGPTATQPIDPLNIGGALGIGGLYPVVPYQATLVGAAGTPLLRFFSVIAVDAVGRRTALMTTASGDHFFNTTWNSTLTGVNYIHLEWFSMFPAPDHFEVYDVNTAGTTQWRFVSNVAPSGGLIESYNVQANPAGPYVSTQPSFNEAGLLNFRNLSLYPNEIAFTPGDATPTVRVTNDALTANVAPLTYTNFDDGVEGQIIRIRVGDALSTFQNNGNIVTGTGADILAVLGAVYTFIRRTAAWHCVSFPLTSLSSSLSAQMGSSSSSMTLSGVADTQVSAVGIGNGADATDDTLFTYTLPANALSAAGKSVRVISSGGFAPSNPASFLRVAIWFAGTALADSDFVAYDTSQWAADLIITRIDATHVNARGTVAISGGSAPGTIVNLLPNLVVANLGSNTSIIKTTGKTGSSLADEVVAYMQKVYFDN